MGSRFTTTIDLTARARRTEKEKAAARQFPPPDPPLPLAEVGTLPARVQAACASSGWSSLMPVQAKAVPYLLEGRDLIVQSRTGSGKTGAFLLPLFGRLDPALPHVQALILSPTRELARQIYVEFDRMRVGLGLKGVLIYGGVGYDEQESGLREGAHVVVGTPGRILDHLSRSTLTCANLKVLVLDEADEMLSMGFLPAMRALAAHLPAVRQSSMFSATMPPRVRELGRMFLQSPSFLGLSQKQISVDTILHQYCRTDLHGKDRALIRLLEYDNPSSAIIFANTRNTVTYLAAVLVNYGFLAAGMSGNLSQQQREKAMHRLRSGRLRLLVATDVAARGIDISQLSHVIQYDVPENAEMYIHRTGRTARAGRAGTAVTLATFEDEVQLSSIARFYALHMEKRQLPTDEETVARITARATSTLEGKMRGKSNRERERLERFVPMVRALAADEPALLAMLVDELYHRRTHGSGPAAGSRSRNKKRLARER